MKFGHVLVPLFLFLFLCVLVWSCSETVHCQAQTLPQSEVCDAKLKVTSQPGETSTMHVPRKRFVSSKSDLSDEPEIDPELRYSFHRNAQIPNKLLEFARVVKAKEQIVAGTLHHLTVEAIDAGTKKLYEAKVWVKPWLNFKELQEFKHAGDSPSLTASDLGVKRDGHEPGWRNVPAHDPVVKDAANHAVTTIQQRSNSIVPYELLDILHAKAEVIEDSAKFDMLLKLKRGSKEEKFKVEVHKNLEGTFHLNQMQQEHVDSV